MYSRFIYSYYILSNWDMVYGMDPLQDLQEQTAIICDERDVVGILTQHPTGPGP